MCRGRSKHTRSHVAETGGCLLQTEPIDTPQKSRIAINTSLLPPFLRSGSTAETVEVGELRTNDTGSHRYNTTATIDDAQA